MRLLPNKVISPKVGRATVDRYISGIGLGLLLLSAGCRGLRAERQTHALSTARQWSLRGSDFLQQEKYGDAENLFAEALRHSQADERAHWGMAEVLWEQGDEDQAIAHMEQAAVISGANPRGANPDLIVRLGEMAFARGDYAGALKQADAALSSQRDHGGGWALRGKVLQHQSDWEGAKFSFHRALAAQEHYPEVQIALAEIYQTSGRPQRALATLDAMMDAVQEDEVSSTAWLLRGQAFADLGQQRDAKLCLRQASLNATDEECELLLKVAEKQIDFGELAEARVCLGRALRHDPNNQNARRIQEQLDLSFQSFTSKSSLIGFELPTP